VDSCQDRKENAPTLKRATEPKRGGFKKRRRKKLKTQPTRVPAPIHRDVVENYLDQGGPKGRLREVKSRPAKEIHTKSLR